MPDVAIGYYCSCCLGFCKKCVVDSTSAALSFFGLELEQHLMLEYVVNSQFVNCTLLDPSVEGYWPGILKSH